MILLRGVLVGLAALPLAATAAGWYIFLTQAHKVSHCVVKTLFRIPAAFAVPMGWVVYGNMWLAATVSYRIAKYVPGLAARLQRSARTVTASLLCMETPQSTIKAVDMQTCTVGEDHVLRAYLVLPTDLLGPYPTVIYRTPYGAQPSEPTARELAERGFAVLVQDTRGRFTSEGDFVPVQDEREDGKATVEWVRKQSWSNGRVGVCGISYVGLSAWAAVGTAGDKIDAAVIITSQSRVKRLLVDEHGAINLELIATWVYLVFRLLAGGKGFKREFAENWCRGTLGKALKHLPVNEIDHKLLGRPMDLWQNGIGILDNFDLPFWDDKDVLHDFSTPTPPVQLVAGWYDFFKECQLDDFRKAGPRARLLILPSWHWGLAKNWPLVANVTVWAFQEHLQARPPPCTAFPSSRVWAAALGDPEEFLFLPFEDWPPASDIRSYHLYGSELRLDAGGPWRRSYRHDPANPTPSIGGPSFSFTNAGPCDQASVESRDDVLVFTSEPLTEPLLIAGRVTMQLAAELGSPSADFVGRLCDVMPDGKSINRCEGLTRVQGPGQRNVTVDFGSTCCRFYPGHRIRLHVCSAAFPRLMQNLQTGEPLMSATRMEAAWHSVGEGSVLQLPVILDPPELVPLLPAERWDWASRPETHMQLVSIPGPGTKL